MKKHQWILVCCIGLAIILVACMIRFNDLFQSKNVNIDVSSTLMEAIDIAELSTAEFKYRGIADIYGDESRTEVKCRACYNAVVKAGINMEDVTLVVDEINKTVTATLPDIELKVTIIDEQSISLLPSDEDVTIDTVLKYSKEDAEKEASESAELVDTAKDNLKATIEGLLYPILKARDYTLLWQ